MLTKFLFFVLCILTTFLLAYIWSSDRKKIKYNYLLLILIVQIGLAYFFLKSNIGEKVISIIVVGFGYLLNSANEGTRFIFGSLVDMDGGHIFFFSVAMPIIVMSAIIGILQYLKILPVLIKVIGFVLSKITGMGKLESFNAVSSLAVGQSENFIAYKKIIGHLPSNVLYTMAATAMSTVSLAIAGAYMGMLSIENGFDPRYVVVAMVMNMFGTFFVLTIINPYEKSEAFDYDNLHINLEENIEKQSFFEMLAEYILDGFKIAVIVSAMLIGFIALLSLIDVICNAIFGITFTGILGYIFYPMAWLLRIPDHELHLAGEIMGTKLVSNEFAAMDLMVKKGAELSIHAKAILSVFLISFANFSSIGIIIGAIQAVSKKASIKVARFGLKIVYGASIVSFLSATIVGLFV
ncbi:NupC/NupG family nucleoside CNT transporter [Allofrancisella guangzhouensis]|uniref:Nucleoside permease n=1 Tax=Allofrancisella guangzhouensis TaxID=594679 RepID=A0A0A8E2L0_9GAMM|nr:nucleoside transporter C-terminal domain-containing protein [Allofrancisella guangzhouensis]AJC48223.1 nucleoside permease [Allofrancisella guangzhouensis]MBK2027157.1 NupC/NupG family nucleoside CNT transporter [Allofrancisella guangzhouensis]MBK2044581.1 NupC/NupG family nucleoside CNT transporter [Allofrancisella guangzhouensis]MBK2046001.1 NupC/NupG family nucleoside CNT transporter [Allofrancisella guangzhouensis]